MNMVEQAGSTCEMLHHMVFAVMKYRLSPLFFTFLFIRILSPPNTGIHTNPWEYSNCFRSKSIIACQLSVVLTEPPFRNGSFIIPAIIFAIRTDQPFCFGYRSRSAVRSLICNGHMVYYACPKEKVMAAYHRLAPNSCFVFEYRIFNFQRTMESVISVSYS